MIQSLTIIIVILIFILHTICTHLLNWFFRVIKDEDKIFAVLCNIIWCFLVLLLLAFIL